MTVRAGVEGRWPPSYPPKTPPPPKRPINPPPPETGLDPGCGPARGAGTAAAGSSVPARAHGPVTAQARVRARIANRRAANWTLDAAEWARTSAGPKAARQVAAQIREWGYRPTRAEHAGRLAEKLAAAALEDGGRRISVHLADQDRQALVLVLSHQPGAADPGDGGLLAELAAMGVLSCGTDTDRDGGGRRRWALIAL